jgi:hypothetical protein
VGPRQMPSPRRRYRPYSVKPTTGVKHSKLSPATGSTPPASLQES